MLPPLHKERKIWYGTGGSGVHEYTFCGCNMTMIYYKHEPHGCWPGRQILILVTVQSIRIHKCMTLCCNSGNYNSYSICHTRPLIPLFMRGNAARLTLLTCVDGSLTIKFFRKLFLSGISILKATWQNFRPFVYSYSNQWKHWSAEPSPPNDSQ